MKKRLSIFLSVIALLTMTMAFPAQAAVTDDPLSWIVKGGETGRGAGFQYNKSEGTLYAWADKGGSKMSEDYVEDKGDTMLDSDMFLRTKSGVTTPPAQDQEYDYYMTNFGWTFDYTTLKNEWIQDRAMFRSRQENEWASYVLMFVGSSVTEKVVPGLSLYISGEFGEPLAHVDFNFEIGVTYRVKIQMIENIIKVWFYKAGTTMPSSPTLQATVDMEKNYVPSGDFQWMSWAGNTVLSNMAIGTPDIVNKGDPAPKKLSIPGMSIVTPTTKDSSDTPRTETPKTDTPRTEAPKTETPKTDSATVSTDTVSTGGKTETDSSGESTTQSDSTTAAPVDKNGTDDENPNSALPIVLIVCGVLIVAGAVAAFLILNRKQKEESAEESENP